MTTLWGEFVCFTCCAIGSPGTHICIPGSVKGGYYTELQAWQINTRAVTTHAFTELSNGDLLLAPGFTVYNYIK